MVQLISAENAFFDPKKLESKTFEAQLKLSAFDYWLQFIGLVCSFVGLSANELTTIATEFIASKVRRRKSDLLSHLSGLLDRDQLAHLSHLSSDHQRRTGYHSILQNNRTN